MFNPGIYKSPGMFGCLTNGQGRPAKSTFARGLIDLLHKNSLLMKTGKKSFKSLQNLGVLGKLVILCEVLVEMAVILHGYCHTPAISHRKDNITWGMVDDFPEPSHFL